MKKHSAELLLTDRMVKEVENCTFSKTVLMILVVFYHCSVFWTGEWFVVSKPCFQAAFLDVLAQWMNSFLVYSFTLISGYLFYFLKYELGRYERFWPFFSNKSKRLLVPYAFISITWVIPASNLFYDFTLQEIIQKYLFGIAPSQLWFLLMLFGVFVVFWPLSDFFEANSSLGGMLVAAICGIGIIGHQMLPNVFQILSMCTYLPFFWIGFKMRQNDMCWIRKIPAIVWILADLVLFGISNA